MAASSEFRKLVATVTRELRAAERSRAKIPVLKRELRENIRALKAALRREHAQKSRK